MISVIICSISPEMRQAVENNISATIGSEHEFITFDNRDAKFGLCKVYNLCAAKARYPYLLFVHEDIELHSTGWGKRLIEHCTANPHIGLVGVAGFGFVGLRPKPSTPRLSTFFRVRHLDKYSSAKKDVWRPKGVEGLFRVSLCDGQFLFSPKPVWEAHPFDEHTFTHFHLYDLDYSMQVNRTHEVMVTTEIDITHFSLGKFDQTHLSYYRKFLDKWRFRLPMLTLPDMTDRQRIVKVFTHDSLNHLRDLNFSLIGKNFTALQALTSYSIFSLTIRSLFSIPEVLLSGFYD